MTENRWVWGCDLKSSQLNIAAFDGNDYAQAQLIVEKPANERNLAALHRATRETAFHLAELVPPICVWLEQPSGTHRNPSLVAAWGVVQAAIYEALAKLYPAPVSIYPVSSSAWKKQLVGRGDAKPAEYVVAANALFDVGEDEDRAAAVLIATYGFHAITIEPADNEL